VSTVRGAASDVELVRFVAFDHETLALYQSLL